MKRLFIDDNLLEAIKEVVIGHGYANPNLCIKTIAQRFDIDRGRLGSKFKNKYGHTISDVINDFRVEKAKELLEEDYCPITRVHVIVGFSSRIYFYQIFKKATGLSPSEYRVKVNS